jgi:hypothetical protein
MQRTNLFVAGLAVCLRGDASHWVESRCAISTVAVLV